MDPELIPTMSCMAFGRRIDGRRNCTETIGGKGKKLETPDLHCVSSLARVGLSGA